MDAKQLPGRMKPLKPYLTHAKQVEGHAPLMSYYCRCFAAQLGVELRQQDPGDQESTMVLLSLLDELEAAKVQLQEQIASQDGFSFVENFSMKIFDQADQQDRAGKATKLTARSFYAASIFMNTLRQFSNDKSLPDDLEQKLKYAKWKAADITTALREGRVPQAGPPGDALSEFSEGGAADDADGAPAGSAGSGSAPSPHQSSSPHQSVGTVPSSDFSALGMPSADPVRGGGDAGGFSQREVSPRAPTGSGGGWGGPAGAAGGALNRPSTPDMASALPLPPKGTRGPASDASVDTEALDKLKRDLERQKREFEAEREAFERDKQRQQAAEANKKSAAYSAAPAYDNQGVDPEQLAFATKHARFAISALQFEDVGTAIKELKISLQALEKR